VRVRARVHAWTLKSIKNHKKSSKCAPEIGGNAAKNDKEDETVIAIKAWHAFA
jgi:hypothetical protein